VSRRTSDEQLTLAVVIGTFAAGVTALIAGFAYVLQSSEDLHEAIRDPTYYQASFAVGLTAVGVIVLVCPLLFIIVGLRLYRLSVRRGLVSIWQYAATGVGVSGVAAIGAFLVFESDRQFAVPLTVIGGTIATLAFWAVARPDRE
jgi:hypothetical protein